MQIIYLNDYYEKEETIVKEYGVPCTRIIYPFQKNVTGIQSLSIFRGPKMNNEAYKKFICDLEEKTSCSALVSVNDFSKISDAIEYTRCFGRYAPKAITFDIKEDIKEISRKVINSDLNYPLFVRSDIESAAKYVGVENCILRSPENSEIEAVIDPIYRHIQNAGSIIMKEIVSIKKFNQKNMEYRAIVVNGVIICFDYNSCDGLPCPESLSCATQFEDCIKIATENGLKGAYFVDFGIDENENIFVVECKNIINGTIKNMDAFAKGLIKMTRK